MQPWKACYERDVAWLGAAMIKHYHGDDGDVMLLMGAIPKAFASMSVDAYAAEIRAYFDTAVHPTLNRPYRACGYQPMIELLRYLEANGFATDIASGGDRDFMRVVAEDMYRIPPERIIGSALADRLPGDRGRQRTSCTSPRWTSSTMVRPSPCASGAGSGGGRSWPSAIPTETCRCWRFARSGSRTGLRLSSSTTTRSASSTTPRAPRTCWSGRATGAGTVISIKDDWTTVFAARSARGSEGVVESGAASARLVVCLPDLPDRRHIGAFPANVEVVLVSPDAGPIPDLAAVDLIVPIDRVRQPLIETLAATGRPRVIQTLSAGVDWLVGRVPELIVCNARGVFDVPLAEWVVGAILATEAPGTSAGPRRAGGRGVVIVRASRAGRAAGRYSGSGSIGTAVADRLGPLGVEVVGVARTARDGVLGMRDLDGVLPTADILVVLLPLTHETVGLLDARRLALLPDGALVVNAGRGRTVEHAVLVRELERGLLGRPSTSPTRSRCRPATRCGSCPVASITPHIAGDSPGATVRAYALACCDEVRRFAAGRPLINQVAGYLLEAIPSTG